LETAFGRAPGGLAGTGADGDEERASAVRISLTGRSADGSGISQVIDIAFGLEVQQAADGGRTGQHRRRSGLAPLRRRRFRATEIFGIAPERLLGDHGGRHPDPDELEVRVHGEVRDDVSGLMDGDGLLFLDGNRQKRWQ
jgi:hypothetical protein